MSESEVEEFFSPAHKLIAARCNRCGSIAAGYWVSDRGADWRRATGRTACRCDPPPMLPEGDKLDRWVERARSSGEDTPSTRAPLKVRV